MKFKDKIVLVTGSARGIGKAILTKFVEEGAIGIIWDVQTELAQKTAQELTEKGGKVFVVENVDVRNLESVEKATKQVLEKYNRIDILVNNAGILRDASLKKMTAENWQAVLDVNLTGVFNCAKVVSQVMTEQQYGKIVNISSIVGITGNFGQSNYVAAKAAIVGLTKTWAKELGRYNINVNAVAPGAIDTEMFASVPEDHRKAFIQKIPMGRIGTPEDIANLCAFLASEESSFITGQTIIADGGGTLG
ncbi:3-oxoacyl-ACP synthase [bacterium 336/3]|nr:3-oxoacyl-ACP synthase [bacterium 336/3]